MTDPKHKPTPQGTMDLFITAFNAAHECEEMGYDGTACVEALPKLVKLLVEAGGCLLAIHGNVTDPNRDDGWDNEDAYDMFLIIQAMTEGRCKGDT